MKLIPLSPSDRKYNLATHKVVITHTDVAALATDSAALQIFPESGNFVAGTAFRFCGFNLRTAFDASDAAINSLLIELGDGTDPDRVLAQTQIAVDGTEILSATSNLAYAYPAADTLDAKFTCAGGASPLLSEFTSGEIEIYLHVSVLTDLNRPSGGL